MLPEYTKGIIRENPLFVQLLGVCPALATTSSLTNALGMGAAFTAVLIGSNLIISALKNLSPPTSGYQPISSSSPLWLL